MLYIQQDTIQFNYSLCQQCGACIVTCPKQALSYTHLKNGLNEIAVNRDLCVKCKRCVYVCPSNREKQEENELGRLSNRRFYIAYNEKTEIRKNSSSGGVCKTLIIESLKSGFVDGVYSLKKLEKYPSAEGEFYTLKNVPTFSSIPNSVYHSVMMCTEMAKVKKVHRLMIVGTSCQLYAMERALYGKYDELVKVCIFCKQQKHLGATFFWAKVLGKKLKFDSNFEATYRGQGWPGVVDIDGKSLLWEKAAALPFGHRLWIVPGCDICGDSFGSKVGADLSLMDPWGICKRNEMGETLVVVHSERGLKLLQETKHLIVKKKNYEEIRPALGEKDIQYKRMLIPYFRGEEVSNIVEDAAKAELNHRKKMEEILEKLPRMPFFFYRILNKVMPPTRDLILNKVHEY